MGMSCTGVLERKDDDEYVVVLKDLLGYGSAVSRELHQYLHSTNGVVKQKVSPDVSQILDGHYDLVCMDVKDFIVLHTPDHNKVTTETCTEDYDGFEGYRITVDNGEKNVVKSLQQALLALGLTEYCADDYRLTIGFN